MSDVGNPSPNLITPGSNHHNNNNTSSNHHRPHTNSISSVSSASSPRPAYRNLPNPSPRFNSSVALPDATGHRHSSSSSLLTPHKGQTKEKPLSRSSSRSSIRRSHSPSVSLDDPVAIRNHMSTLKHSIRQQQAQLNNLESIVRTGPRPYSADILGELNDPITTTMNNASTSSSSTSYTAYGNGHSLSSSVTSNGSSSNAAPPSAFRGDVAEGSSSSSNPATTTIKMKRRSSYDVLLNIAGPESSLPLPKRIEGTVSASDAENGVIREGVPLSFGGGNLSSSPSSPPGHYKRISSPTRTLSRIPISAVGNARALADEGQGSSPRLPGNTSRLSAMDTSSGDISISSPSPMPSPNKRLSFTPGNTTKVLADLQTGVVNARNALEHTKAQLRLSQRTVSQLTRQAEDLKESRERLRLENEGLNNVVARKERLLQEVLERARKAEAEATTLKQQLKSETTVSKKALRDMESALAESTALSSKSEREYITLRDSMKGLTEGWKHDTDRLRDEMNKRDARWKAEAEKVGKQYRQLVEEVKKAEKGKQTLKDLQKEDEGKNKEVEAYWQGQITKMRQELEGSNGKTEAAVKTAAVLQEELARLRRLMRGSAPKLGEELEERNTPDS